MAGPTLEDRRSRIGPGILAARFKLVMRIEPGATEEVYDLEADPAEIASRHRRAALGTRKRLLQAAHEHVEKTVSAEIP